MWSHSAPVLRHPYLPWAWSKRVSSPIILPGLPAKLYSALEAKYGSDCKFVFNHQASAEIHPAKAGYIEENFSCNVIFRDIIEISLLQKDNVPKPHYL
jgi:hypothetical protein